MESDEVATGGERQIMSVPPTVSEETALEKPKVAIDSIEFRNLATEEDVCRICQDRESTSQPLLGHCACKGSIGFVHKGCLQMWLDVSRERQCEICKQDYPFSLPDPELYPYGRGFEYSMDFRYWLVPMIALIFNHVAVAATTIPNGHMRHIVVLWGSVVYVLLCSLAYLIWRYYVLYFSEDVEGDVLYEDPLVWQLREGQGYSLEAIFDYLVPYDVLHVYGLRDIGAIAFDYMLPFKLYNIAVDIGAAAYAYLFSYFLYFSALFGVGACFGFHPGVCQHLISLGYFNYPPNWKFGKAILATLSIIAAQRYCLIAMSILYKIVYNMILERQ